MAVVDLGRAFIGLLSGQAGSQVQIPRLQSQSISSSQDRAFVRFAGDKFPTAFQGEGREMTFALTCLYPRDEHAELAELLLLLEHIAPDSPDPRLILRTHAGLASGLNHSLAVVIDGPIAQSWAYEAVTVTFTARVVQYELADG